MQRDRQRNLEFRRLLVQISTDIYANDLATLKYMCSDDIPKGRREKITTASGFWEVLEEKELIGPENLGFLRSLLETLPNGLNLVRLLETYEHSYLLNQRIGVDQDGGDLSRELRYVSENVGHEWKWLARSLGLTEPALAGLTESGKSIRENMFQALLIWQRNRGPAANKETLIKALRSENLNLIADNIEDGSI